jgi:predicted PurR-regulated permease PerM
MRRVGVPAALGAALVLALLTGALGYGVVRLAEPASDWVQRMPRAMRSVERKIIPLRRPVQDVSKLADRVERITDVDKKPRVREVAVDKPSLAETAVQTASDLLAGAVIMLIALYFMLIWGDRLIARLIGLIPDLRGQERTTSVMHAIERRMSAYLRTVLVINALLGAAVGASMFALGMPNPILWGVMAGLINFVPYLGSLVGVGVLALASLLTFDDISTALLPPAVYLALTALEGNIITPTVMGRTFRISPLVIFIWLVLWGWLWGLAGAVLAVPLLMLLKLTGDQSRVLGPLAVFLER